MVVILGGREDIYEWAQYIVIEMEMEMEMEVVKEGRKEEVN